MTTSTHPHTDYLASLASDDSETTIAYPEQYTSLHQHLLAAHDDDIDNVDAEQVIEITASCLMVSSYTIGGIDLDVSVIIDGTEYAGEVTLLREHDGSWRAWGARENWMSQELLNAVDASSDEDSLMANIVDECRGAIYAHPDVEVAADEAREDGRE